MDSTYLYRVQQIEDTLITPTLIMEEYPKFKDFEYGELVLSLSLYYIIDDFNNDHEPLINRLSQIFCTSTLLLSVI